MVRARVRVRVKVRVRVSIRVSRKRSSPLARKSPSGSSVHLARPVGA